MVLVSPAPRSANKDQAVNDTIKSWLVVLEYPS